MIDDATYMECEDDRLCSGLFGCALAFICYWCGEVFRYAMDIANTSRGDSEYSWLIFHRNLHINQKRKWQHLHVKKELFQPLSIHFKSSATQHEELCNAVGQKEKTKSIDSLTVTFWFRSTVVWHVAVLLDIYPVQ